MVHTCRWENGGQASRDWTLRPQAPHANMFVRLKNLEPGTQAAVWAALPNAEPTVDASYGLLPGAIETMPSKEFQNLAITQADSNGNADAMIQDPEHGYLYQGDMEGPHFHVRLRRKDHISRTFTYFLKSPV